ncbi:peptide deformylase 1A, chloroplastic/mitochondrial, partial [Tanacetum coccineum]
GFRSHSSAQTREGWLAWLGKKKKTIALVIALPYFTSEKSDLPHVVTAGAPVLHQPAREVYPGEIGSARIEKIIVLEDRKSYIALSPNKVNEERDRRPFDLLVILNPKLKEEQQNGIVFRRLCK